MSEIFQKPLTLEEIKAKTEQYIFNTYNRLPRAFYFGQGEFVYDTENNTYIDFMSGIAVTALGHGRYNRSYPGTIRQNHPFVQSVL